MPNPSPHAAQETEDFEHTIECPCCGDIGATSKGGYFYDGQKLECGCSGSVSVAEDDAWINNGDEPCQPDARCHH